MDTWNSVEENAVTLDSNDFERKKVILNTFTPHQRYSGGRKHYHIENYNNKLKKTAFKQKVGKTIFGKEGSPQRSHSPFNEEDKNYFNTQFDQSFFYKLKKQHMGGKSPNHYLTFVLAC